MKVHSGHIVFSKKTQFRDLAPVCKDLLTKFMQETKQQSEDPEFFNIVIDTNFIDLKNNRKPEGFNRLGSMRMIFPIKEKNGGVEFYIYRSSSATDVVRVTESISKLLQKKGYKHDVCWDRTNIEGKK
jgi:hypothetical protein